MGRKVTGVTKKYAEGAAESKLSVLQVKKVSFAVKMEKKVEFLCKKEISGLRGSFWF